MLGAEVDNTINSIICRLTLHVLRQLDIEPMGKVAGMRQFELDTNVDNAIRRSSTSYLPQTPDADASRRSSGVRWFGAINGVGSHHPVTFGATPCMSNKAYRFSCNTGRV